MAAETKMILVDAQRDIEFLMKMKEQVDCLKESGDGTRLEYLDKMISDWIRELRKKAANRGTR